MLSASSSLSLRTALDNVLTWTNLKPSKSSTQDRPLARNRDIFSVMVTPDRIPQFFIPSLEVDHIFVHVNPGDGGQPGCAQELQVTCGAKPSCASPEPCSSRREAVARREALCKKAFLPSTDGSLFTQDLERAADHSDPATRAALSLPHLAKITTPYGFLALGESPNIRRKESLFFEQDPQDIRSLLSHRKKSNSLSRSRSSPVGVSEQPPTWQQEPTLQPIRSSRSVSWDAICKATSSPPATPSNSLSLTPCNKPEKTRFQSLIKKHLASIKRMRSVVPREKKRPLRFDGHGARLCCEALPAARTETHKGTRTSPTQRATNAAVKQARDCTSAPVFPSLWRCCRNPRISTAGQGWHRDSTFPLLQESL